MMAVFIDDLFALAGIVAFLVFIAFLVVHLWPERTEDDWYTRMYHNRHDEE